MQALTVKLTAIRANNCNMIDQFREDLAKDAAYALSWRSDVFMAAARVKVIDQVIAAIQTDITRERLTATVTQSVTTRARYPSHGSSPTSNLMDQCELAAYAEILEYLQDQ